jgi:hypothetical protein
MLKLQELGDKEELAASAFLFEILKATRMLGWVEY